MSPFCPHAAGRSSDTWPFYCKAGKYRVDVWPEGRGLWSFGKHMAASTILDLPRKGWECTLQGKEIKARKNEVTFGNQVRTLLEEIFGA